MMKFQKINIMLMIAMLSSNLSFCPEVEPLKQLINQNKYSHEDTNRALENLGQDKDNFTKESVVQRYRHLALQHHPDKDGKTENMQILNNSREYIEKHILNDPDSNNRKAYQNHRDTARQEQEAARQEAARQEAARKEAVRKKEEEYAKRVEAARERARKAAEGDKGTEPIISGQDSISSKVINMSDNDLATKLTPEDVQALSPETIKAITNDPAKLKALLQNTPALKTLSPEQVEAIPADKLVEAINKDLSAVLKTRQSLPDSFVDKLSPTQAKALVDEHSKWFSSIKADFSDEQIEHLRSLAKTQEGSETITRATTLTKRLAKGNLTPEEQNQFDTYMNNKLDTKEKEIIINQYADSLAEASGLKKEKGKWFFKDDNKIKQLETELRKNIDKFIKKYTKGNEYPILLRDIKTNELAIEVVDMSKINPIESMEDQFLKLLSNRTLSDKMKKTISQHDVLENNYARWFSGRIDLSKPFDEQVSELIPEQEQRGNFKATTFENFDSRLQERVKSELNKKVNNAFANNPISINPEFIKYVNPETLSKLSTEQIKALSTEQIKSLSTEQIKSLSSDQIKALSVDQIKSMSADQLDAFTDEQLAELKKVNQSQADRIVTRRNLLQKTESDKQQKAETKSTAAQESQKALDKILTTPKMKDSDLRKDLTTMSNTDTMILSQKIKADAREVNRTINTLLTIKDPSRFRSFISTLPIEKVQLIDNETLSKMLLHENGEIGDFTEAQLVTKFSKDQIKYLLTSRLLNDEKQIKRLKLYQLPDDMIAADVKALGLSPESSKALITKLITRAQQSKPDLSTKTTVAQLTPADAPAAEPEELQKLSAPLIEILPTDFVTNLDENQVGSLPLENVNPDAIKGLLESSNPTIQAETLSGISDDQAQEQLPEVKSALKNLPEAELVGVAFFRDESRSTWVTKVAQEVVATMQEAESKPQAKKETNKQRKAREQAERTEAMQRAYKEIEGKDWDETSSKKFSKKSAKQAPKKAEPKISTATNDTINKLKTLITNAVNGLVDGTYDQKVAELHKYTDSLSNTQLKEIIEIAKNDPSIKEIGRTAEEALARKASK